MLKESIAEYSSYCRNEQYTSIDIDLIHIYRRNVKEIQSRPFFIVYRGSALKTCWNYRGQPVFYTALIGPPRNLILELKAVNFLCYDLRSVLQYNKCQNNRGTISYATFRGPSYHQTCLKFLMLRFEVCPFIGYVRNTVGGTFLMLCFRICHLIILLELQRADHFLCYVSRSALS